MLSFWNVSSNIIITMIQVQQKQQNQIHLQPHIIQTDQLKPSLESEFIQEYRAYFHDVPELITKNQILDNLSKHLDIRYDEQSYPIPFSIKLVDHNVNYEILQCKIQIVFFSMTLKIYNVKGNSNTHIFNNISMTKTGIYSTLFKHQKIVIKCLHLSQEKFEQFFIKAVQEYCILKISSNLKIGPSVNKIFGFDLIMYDDCIQFGMQQCEKILYWNKQQTLFLKRKLYCLHQLHVVHQDIKPMNIMFSPSLQEYVFIDYGFSRVVAENIGEKTCSTFMGSFGFCSPEMTRCFYQTTAFVDLYNNDVYCLNKSLSQLQKCNFSKVGITNQEDNHDIIYYDQLKQKKVLQSLLLIYIKSQILTNENISQYKRHIINNRQEFLNFFATIPLRWELQLFKLYYLINNILGTKQPQVCLNFHSCFKVNTKFNRLLTDNQNQEDFRLSKLSKGISQVQESILSTYLVQGNLKQLLLNHHLIEQITLTQYYYYFIQYVDICGTHSTCQERQSVAKLMINLRKIENRKGFTNDNENCLNYFLHIFLQDNNKFLLSLIPNILSNLIIYQTYTEGELFQIYKKICQLQLDPIFHMMLLFKCYVIRQWIIQRAISRYKFTNIIIDTQNLILTKVKQIVSQSRGDISLIVFLEKLLLFKIDHSLQIDINKLSEQLLDYRGQIDGRFYIELILFININQLDNKKQSDNLQGIRIHLENIYEYHKTIYCQTLNLDYATLRLLNFACEINISYTANDYYDKIKTHFQDQSLISKYKFHYAVQYNNYCNHKISVQEIFIQFLRHSQQISYINDEEIMSKLSKLIHNYRFKQFIQQQSQREHLSKLWPILCFDRFKNIHIPSSKECNNYDYNIVKYFRINYIYFQSIEQLPIPNKRKELQNKIQILKEMLKGVQCNT